MSENTCMTCGRRSESPYCNACWEVESRIADYLKHPNGRAKLLTRLLGHLNIPALPDLRESLRSITAQVEAACEASVDGKLLEDRDQLLARVADLEASLALARKAERKWERALSDASGGRYDMPAGIAALVAELRGDDALPRRVLSGLAEHLEEATKAVIVMNPRETFRISGLPKAVFARLLACEGRGVRVRVSVEIEGEPAVAAGRNEVGHGG